MVRLVSLEEDEEQEARIQALNARVQTLEKINMNLVRELDRVQGEN